MSIEFRIREHLKSRPVFDLIDEVKQTSNSCWQELNPTHRKVVETAFLAWKYLRDLSGETFMFSCPPLERVEYGRGATFSKENCYIHLNKSREKLINGKPRPKDPIIGKGRFCSVKFALLISLNQEEQVTLRKIARNTSLVQRPKENRLPQHVAHHIEVLQRLLNAPPEMRTNLVRIYSYHFAPTKKGDQKTEKLSIFLDFYPRTLRDLLQQPIPSSEKYRIATEILNGLKNLHALGIVHRDLKPENIFLDEDGTVHIGDFNLSALAGKTARGGTLHYVAPEKFSSRYAQTASDLWSVGIILARLFCCSTQNSMQTAQWEHDRHKGNVKQILQGKKKLGAEDIEKLRQVRTIFVGNLKKALQDMPEPILPLIDSLLQEDPTQRPTAAEALENLAKKQLCADNVPLCPLQPSTSPRSPPL